MRWLREGSLHALLRGCRFGSLRQEHRMLVNLVEHERAAVADTEDNECAIIVCQSHITMPEFMI